MRTSRILFAGMHDSGKTTYIAALWDYINSDKKDKNFILNTLADSENEYLEKIRSEWLQCKKVTRTNLNTESVKMNLCSTENQENIIIEIPDFSGELFNNHFQHREWSTEYNDLIRNLSGIVLFINPKDEKNRMQFISDAVEIEEMLKIPGLDVNEEVVHTSWSQEYSSHQVKLVEALQFVENYREESFPVRVSVIISRWDLLYKTGISPEQWLKLQLPLLDQYLLCNSKSFKVTYFGISAQGGDYSISQDVERLLSMEPYERPIVRFGDTNINDLTAPINWLTRN